MVVHFYRKAPVVLARIIGALLSPLLWTLSTLLFRYPRNQPIRILVQEGYRLGDMLLCSPALALLREHYPDARIDLLSFHAATPLIEQVQWVDRVVSVHPPWAFAMSRGQAPRAYWRMARRLRAERYDMAIDLRGDPRGLLPLYLAAIPTRLSFADFGGGCFCSRSYRTPTRIRHQMSRCSWIVQQITDTRGVAATRPYWPCRPAHDEVQPSALSTTRTMPDHPILIHPGASMARKCWAPRHFAHVIDRLAEQGLGCALIGAESDSSQIQAILELTHAACPVFLPRFDQIESLLKRANGVVCNDSFMQHAAWALGVPTVVLYGPGSPLQTAPLALPARVVWDNTILHPPYHDWRGPRSMADNSVATVVRAVTGLMEEVGGGRGNRDRRQAG